MSIPESLLKHIEARLNDEFEINGTLQSGGRISGGDINTAYSVTYADKRFFIKLNRINLLQTFMAEELALNVIKASGSIACPKGILVAGIDEYAYLLLEYMELSPQGDDSRLGNALANMHKNSAPLYGWQEDNYIGSTVQLNTQNRNWNEFWLEMRLRPQLTMAMNNGFQSELKPIENKLVLAHEFLLRSHKPVPSLLHGDLWSGNKAFLMSGEPVIFDPASYYGDRETDIAMTELFGGFGKDFYSAYNAAWQLPKDYEKRKYIYQLYHMLNHLNLFGAGYLHSCLSLTNKIISLG